MEINLLVDEGLEGCPAASWLESLAEKILIAQGADAQAELDLVIVGQEKIHQLNLSYLGKDEPTDVLAFSMLPEPPEGGAAAFIAPPDGIKHLGEVIVSYPQAVIQAEEYRHSVKREIALLITHGVLHLFGYEDNRPDLARQMRAREAEIMSSIGGELE